MGKESDGHRQEKKGQRFKEDEGQEQEEKGSEGGWKGTG